MEQMNKETPSKEKKKELKSYTFTLILPNDKETPKGPKDEKPNFKLTDEKSDKIILNFTLNLYEEEIVFNANQRKENFKVGNII